MRFDSPADAMRYALNLAERGLGMVEPNPCVGAVVVNDRLEWLGEGWHQQYGGPHAEIFALSQAGAAARGATLFVTLEPCCHFGKTPPCSQAVIAAGIRRVVIGTRDSNPQVAGKGVDELKAAGIDVEAGLLEDEAESLIAPFRKLITTGRPWIIAKWAMTLDGKLATKSGDSRWITNESSRKVVHELRGRMDAIVVGIGTALADDPLLTARPVGPRTPLRVVLDSQARLPLSSQLVATAKQVPLLIAVSASAPAANIAALQAHGIETLALPADAPGSLSLSALYEELGRRRCTNVLVEGGRHVLGSFFDQRLIDEVYAFIAPKLIGGETAPSPLGGAGHDLMQSAAALKRLQIREIDGDVLIRGRL